MLRCLWRGQAVSADVKGAIERGIFQPPVKQLQGGKGEVDQWAVGQVAWRAGVVVEWRRGTGARGGAPRRTRGISDPEAAPLRETQRRFADDPSNRCRTRGAPPRYRAHETARAE